MGLRLALRRAQAEDGDIMLLDGDESEALTHSDPAHAWAQRGADLRVAASGQSRKVAIMGVLDATARELIVHTSTTKRSTDFIVLLALLDSRYGPQPGRTAKPAVRVLDYWPIHPGKATRAAIAARPRLTVAWLPRYAPEFDTIAPTWRDLDRHHLAHRPFEDAADLDEAVHEAVRTSTPNANRTIRVANSESLPR